MTVNPYSYHPSASAAEERVPRDPAMVGRAVGLVSALISGAVTRGLTRRGQGSVAY